MEKTKQHNPDARIGHKFGNREEWFPNLVSAIISRNIFRVVNRFPKWEFVVDFYKMTNYAERVEARYIRKYHKSITNSSK